ncbi:MAG: C40 family peptidase [Desulfobacterales bacterium]|nr:C40 family peptidase [Desulfobacterales bacterium]
MIIIYLTRHKHNSGKIASGILLCACVWIAMTFQYRIYSTDGFVGSLKKYNETEYVWGGETRAGIDCSGLIRMGLRDAFLRNGRLGAALRVWLVDTAAWSIPVEYGNIFVLIGEFESVNSTDCSKLPEGSVAVTADGVHTFAYLGKNMWIQASSNDKQVTIKNSKDSDPWFKVPVKIYKIRDAETRG